MWVTTLLGTPTITQSPDPVIEGVTVVLQYVHPLCQAPTTCTYSWSDGKTGKAISVAADRNIGSFSCTVTVNGTTTNGPNTKPTVSMPALVQTENKALTSGINCTAPSCKPNCTIKWTKGSTIKNSPVLFANGALLNRSDAGTYTCNVSNSVGYNVASTVVTVLFAPDDVALSFNNSTDKPIFPQYEKTYNFSKGDPIHINLPVYSIPIFDNFSVEPNNRFDATISNKMVYGIMFFDKSISIAGQSLRLEINETLEEYFGSYTVTFRNSANFSELTFELRPKVTFKVQSGFFNGASQTIFLEKKETSQTEWEISLEKDFGIEKNQEYDMPSEGLSQNTEYQFRVYSSNAFNRSDYSAVVEIKTSINAKRTPNEYADSPTFTSGKTYENVENMGKPFEGALSQDSKGYITLENAGVQQAAPNDYYNTSFDKGLYANTNLVQDVATAGNFTPAAEKKMKGEEGYLTADKLKQDAEIKKEPAAYMNFSSQIQARLAKEKEAREADKDDYMEMNLNLKPPKKARESMPGFVAPLPPNTNHDQEEDYMNSPFPKVRKS
ncbi:hypothetical protein MAR_000948 [Mya arenaria]|uniref:Ig-like domain-containing protein n=1 Tax=Mya arenaria TaxID=6604 RepID=A0ABY7FAH9_MYAAR|nr:hypothetical protein MAR_000948 [Mya arenaria]